MTSPEGTYAVVAQKERFAGAVFDVVSDEVRMPGGGTAWRDYTRNIGAVGAVAVDDELRVALVRQYRHPVRAHMWELPAGLLDVHGEAPELTAARELAEEADLIAGRWDPLLRLHTSPGFANERMLIFLARDLTPAPTPHPRTDEESEMTVSMIELDRAIEMIFAGEITNCPCAAGLLAAARFLSR